MKMTVEEARNFRRRGVLIEEEGMYVLLSSDKDSYIVYLRSADSERRTYYTIVELDTAEKSRTILEAEVRK